MPGSSFSRNGSGLKGLAALNARIVATALRRAVPFSVALPTGLTTTVRTYLGCALGALIAVCAVTALVALVAFWTLTAL